MRLRRNCLRCKVDRDESIEWWPLEGWLAKWLNWQRKFDPGAIGPCRLRYIRPLPLKQIQSVDQHP
jgi:hypothetical protein